MNVARIIPLTCHPEPFATLEGKLREGSAFYGRKSRSFALLRMTCECGSKNVGGSWSAGGIGSANTGSSQRGLTLGNQLWNLFAAS